LNEIVWVWVPSLMVLIAPWLRSRFKR
jgi:hypothetical protein